MENSDNSKRCAWCGADPLYRDYHDREWGRPERDARTLFELLILEGFQAGLSWITILRKRAAFREAFQGFDPAVLATWGESDVVRLLQNPGIIRHRGKIEGALRGAGAFLRIEAREGFAPFLWSFAPPPRPRPASAAEVPAQSPASAAMSTALKAEGFSFVGPTITYAFMQASGMVNDHISDCDWG